MNGAERMIYPEPLYGGAPERDSQIRQYLFQLTDYINRLTARVEDMEGASDGGGSGSSAVTSVNGQTGAVVLGAADVGAKPSTYTAPVSSVNGKTGAVSLDASDVHALPDSTVIPTAVTEQTVSGWGFTKNTGTYSVPSGGIPKTDLASDVQASLGKADTALQVAPVTSVNSKTGVVILTASDVGALPDSTAIPANTSDLTNDSGFITLSDVPEVIYDIDAEFHADTADHYFTFPSGVNASTILAALAGGKLPVVRNNYGSLKQKWHYADYNDDGNDVYIQFFRETQFSREVMLYTESDGKAYIDSVSLSSFQRKPVTVWEVQDVSQGLLARNTNISSSLNWHLTDLDLTPYARIKIYSRAGRKTGATAADSSITPASIIEMSLDDRALETVSQNVFIGSSVVQNPNDPNRLGLLTCAVSADKTKFAVVRATTLYGTAATSNTDAYPYVFKIEGYYD